MCYLYVQQPMSHHTIIPQVLILYNLHNIHRLSLLRLMRFIYVFIQTTFCLALLICVVCIYLTVTVTACTRVNVFGNFSSHCVVAVVMQLTIAQLHVVCVV
jgi:hypothetical protein